MRMNPKRRKRVILNQKDIEQALKRIAQDIVSKHKLLENVVLVGIRTGGAFLAFRLGLG